MILPFREWTRAELLRRMNRGPRLVMELAGEVDAVEDRRVGYGLDQATSTLPADHRFRRRPTSIVWHFDEHCPGWPREGSFVEAVGLPSLGQACRECRT